MSNAKAQMTNQIQSQKSLKFQVLSRKQGEKYRK
jgi:hypothetical protein